MDLISGLNYRTPVEPEDLSAAKHERIAVRGQHLSRGFRVRGQSKRRGAECDAENPEQTHQAHARISCGRHVSLAQMNETLRFTVASAGLCVPDYRIGLLARLQSAARADRQIVPRAEGFT
jgi:hypothetical protein